MSPELDTDDESYEEIFEAYSKIWKEAVRQELDKNQRQGEEKEKSVLGGTSY